MSVQTEITRIQSAKRAISEAIGAKGVTVPPTAKLDDLAALAEKIPGPKPEQEKEITITKNGDYSITADVGKVLSKVLAHVNVPTGGGGGEGAKVVSGVFTPTTEIKLPNDNNAKGYLFQHGLGVVPDVFLFTTVDEQYKPQMGTYIITPSTQYPNRYTQWIQLGVPNGNSPRYGYAGTMSAEKLFLDDQMVNITGCSGSRISDGGISIKPVDYYWIAIKYRK